MGLAAAVGQFQLPHRLVVLAGQPQHHVPRQFAQVVGRVGQGEKLARVFVQRALAALHQHFVEIGGELVERQFAGAQVVAQGDDVVPGFPG